MSEGSRVLLPGAEETREGRLSLYCSVGKRLFDTCLAIAGLVITSPLFLLCSIAIPLSSRGPIFFRGVRVGQFGAPFWIFKFRTMIDRQGGPGVTAAGDPRITWLGKWLRKSKVDEIPQLVNIVRGEMSFVGPRPEVPEYVAAYTALQRKVLRAKPGITGPASLRFANEEEVLARFKEKQDFYVSTLMPYKLELDRSYCENIHFFLDLSLICRTVMRLLSRRNGCSEPWPLTNSKTG
jgi:lipopolysaccharide/colanic/teichoic acid biosynthesis glycosyltransferase